MIAKLKVPKRKLLLSAMLLLLAGCGAAGIEPDKAGTTRQRNDWPGIRYLNADNEEELPPLNEDAGLEQLLAYGAAVNPGLKAAFHKWQAALRKVDYAGALPDPKFSFAYFLREIETKVGPQQAKVSFSQMIPALGKLSAMEKQKHSS